MYNEAISNWQYIVDLKKNKRKNESDKPNRATVIRYRFETFV
jgi:hypothetical protein